jgi:hypothetical protein
MDVDLETQKLLEFIQIQWIELPENLRPEKVWVCSYKPIEKEPDNFNTSIERAWFLNHRGLEERNINEFSRFSAAHMDVPWHVGEFQLPRPPSPIFSIGHTFEFGLVMFAKYRNTDSYYLQLSWGKLHGRGYEVRLESEKFVITQGLWIS